MFCQQQCEEKQLSLKQKINKAVQKDTVAGYQVKQKDVLIRRESL